MMELLGRTKNSNNVKDAVVPRKWAPGYHNMLSKRIREKTVSPNVPGVKYRQC